MTATDELRRLLDERGAEHFDGCESTLWGYEQTSESTGAYRYSADEISGGFVNVWLYRLTPAQAVEAALGRGTCRLEREPDSDRLWWCSNCHTYHEHVSEFPWEYCPRCGAKRVTQ